MRRKDIGRAYTYTTVTAHAFYGAHFALLAHQPGNRNTHVADRFALFAAGAQVLLCLDVEKPGNPSESPKGRHTDTGCGRNCGCP